MELAGSDAGVAVSVELGAPSPVVLGHLVALEQVQALRQQRQQQQAQAAQQAQQQQIQTMAADAAFKGAAARQAA